MKTARLIGFDQESRACAYLQQQGLTLVAKNVCFRGGELDLIMRDKETWVCVEVKFRSKSHYGIAAETISPAKIRRMGAAFQRYLSDNGVNPSMAPMRLDALVIDNKKVNWIKNIGV